MSGLADIFVNRDVDGYERNVRAGDETPLSLGGRRVDWHDGDQIDLLRDEVLDLRGLRREVSVRILEVEDDLVPTRLFHARFSISW